MAYAVNLAQMFKINEALTPATDAAGRASTYVSLKGAHKAYACFFITQGNAATILLSVNQATTIAAGGAKPVANALAIWVNLDTAASETLVRATDAVAYTTDAGVKNKIVIFEIDPAKLDVAGGFDCVNVTTGASNVGNITCCYWFVGPNRYSEATMLPIKVD